MLDKALKTTAILLGFFISQLLAGIPEEEVLILTKSDVIEMPQGKTEATLEEIQVPENMMIAKFRNFGLVNNYNGGEFDG